jgi:hypothetical protein
VFSSIPLVPGGRRGRRPDDRVLAADIALAVGIPWPARNTVCGALSSVQARIVRGDTGEVAQVAPERPRLHPGKGAGGPAICAVSRAGERPAAKR